MKTSQPVVILNMAYTGLGIARDLRSHGMPIFAVTAKRNLVGNYTRCAKLLFGPDSADAPERLASFLCDLAGRLGGMAVLFPTRDQDVLFIERFRAALEKHYLLSVPAAGVLSRVLDKWEMARNAQNVGVPIPRTHRLRNSDELDQACRDIGFPCVVKPISSLEWRGEREWKLIGQRKAFAVRSYGELLAEYRNLKQVTPEILIQELIPGPDSNLFTFGCYFDRQSLLKGSFFGRKLLQYPAGFGTGFVVESVAPSIVRDYSVRLLRSIHYHGVAECEFKFDERDHQFKFIEVNARHWDQHRLSTACGVNLSELAYFDLTGRDLPERVPHRGTWKWIAEDSFLLVVPKMLLERQVGLADLLRMVRGKRVYGLFSISDPRPFLRFVLRFFLPFAVRKLVSSLLIQRSAKQVESAALDSAGTRSAEDLTKTHVES